MKFGSLQKKKKKRGKNGNLSVKDENIQTTF
jgi:hypothetical protein